MYGIQNLEKVQQNCRKFWKQEFIGRPYICVTAFKDNVNPISYDSSYVTRYERAQSGDFDSVLQEYEKVVQLQYFDGEALPSFTCEFSPDQYASFFGGKITGQKGAYTTWVHKIANQVAELDCSFRPENTNFSLFNQYYSHAAKFAKDKFLLGILDSHSNLDTLSALVGPENLCMELLDNPDNVAEKLEQLNSLYPEIYTRLYETAGMASTGTIGWQPMWSDQKSAVVQCDFSCMISPDMARKFVIPCIEREVAFLDNSVYHYDGKGALGHFEDILSIKRIHCIQWVPGDGEKRTPYWMDLLKRIQKAGKSIWVYDWTAEEILSDHELIPEQTLFSINFNHESEAKRFMDKLEKKYK